MIRLFNCDNMDFMKSKPDKFYELAIVDPPYGIGYSDLVGLKKSEDGWKERKSTKWDNNIPNDAYFKELFRVSKNQIIWGGNYFTLPQSRCFLIWDKVQRIDQADCEMAWASFDTSARIFQYARGNESGFAPKLKNHERFGINIHPTQKPVALYKWLLKNYAKEGDKIFDSHSGSLSIAIACGEMGYSLDACELDWDYFKDSVARVQRHFTQSNAFMKTPEILVNPLFGK